MLQPRLCFLSFVLIVFVSPPPADGQTVSGGGAVDRLKVMFTPTVCKVRCSQDRCANYCERGNVTTLYSSDVGGGGGGRRDSSHGLGFRVFLCPLLCKNGGVCLQKDRCLCPPNFSGKFCQIPVTAVAHPASSSSGSTNEIVNPEMRSAPTTNQELTRSEFLMPLSHNRETGMSGAPGPSMVQVRVQHPPEASVNVHQVLKVSGSSPALRTLTSSSSGSAGAPSPAAGGVQAQTVRGGGTFTQSGKFKYCFSQVTAGQCSAPLPGLRSLEICCRGVGKAWGTTDCVLCPDTTGKRCPVGFKGPNGTQCVDVNECLQPGRCENGICVNTRGSYSCVCRVGFILDASNGVCISQAVISEEKGQCHRVVGWGLGPSSCSLPILRNITKQICCCSRVGKAWGPECLRCPYFGSACPLLPIGCSDVDECLLSPCVSGRCDNTPGSFHCVCRHGYRLHNNTCTDVDECAEPSQCPGQVCVNAVGSYRCTSCQPGYTLTNRQCADVNECEDSQTCAGQRCVNTDGSYSCTCEDGYRSVRGVCADVDECASVGVCEAERVCVNTVGSFTCDCPPGYRTSGLGRQCRDVDECVQSSQCPGQQCVNTVGSFRCVSCQPGYSSRDGSCQDVDECASVGVCEAERVCVNTVGSFTCDCPPGYRTSGLGRQCRDVDECVQSSQCPGQQCVNTVGSYRCVSCQPGYSSRDGSCQDVDECASVGVCEAERVCVNTVGSFTCDCPPGYRTSGLGRQCRDVDEWQSSQCPGQQCVNTVGSYRCVSCQPGYSSRDGSCQDVDECASVGVCEAERVCVNTVGSFTCDCPPGYRTSGLGRQCRDVDECVQSSQCPGQQCVNTVGSYRCVSCQPGYSSRDGSCQDVDECASVGVCEAERVCVNTVGSFTCDCPPGYRTSGLGRQCRDINECLETDFCFPRGECVNSPGSYSCVCSEGFTLSANRTACVDVDECTNQTLCGGHAYCQNLRGTYLCVCDQGFSSAPDGRSCEDEDECVSLPGVCGSAHCHNVDGSFMCECHRRGHEFDAGSRRCVSTEPRVETDPGSSSSSSSSSSSMPPLPAPRPGEQRECYYNLMEAGTCSLLASNSTQQECCCTLGEGWGLGCQFHRCPPAGSAHFLSLCPSGRGYLTTGTGAFSYADVDECKRFHPEVCRGGVCVNNIPGYHCYCSSGYVYNSTLLECVDHDECEEESCVGGVCVNTVGSYYCSCPPPMVLDDTQRTCVNSSHLTMDESRSLCWQHVTADLVCQSPLLGAQVSFTDCCCLYGEGWGMQCALCPPTDSDDYAALCRSFLPALFPERFTDPGPEPGVRPEPGRGGATPPYFPPFSPDSFPPAVAPDYTTPQQGAAEGLDPMSRTSELRCLPGFYPEGGVPLSFLLPPDPRAERAFGAPPPPPRRGAPPLSRALLPGGPYPVEQEEEEEEEVGWRPGPPFPPFTERSRGGAPRRVYERRFESYAGLNAAEDCGILQGCENGRCIRVAEGYTCDCYHGYELDMTSMTCADVNECEDVVSVDFPCVNARCVNTDGSFSCVCRRGYEMSHRPNHCVAA
ncbi:LOW QUALITY PROTEIN: latent-transforming growth factor beta-binding protein 4-like [Pseudoliparis swirei]|uniref:LOW QUALITY PROTEIN: latent-transforming growth factor beta-binding protein 4-like n=1 Tax=Pseudoliparis swirei TaxID=2059687 RepID=UPI0024BE9654|nr:LOW QUALITY PROTEIN: latent-transforming growth factor beta-binding protein 4-like [Pseudoliparis swirei]